MKVQILQIMAITFVPTEACSFVQIKPLEWIFYCDVEIPEIESDEESEEEPESEDDTDCWWVPYPKLAKDFRND